MSKLKLVEDSGGNFVAIDALRAVSRCLWAAVRLDIWRLPSLKDGAQGSRSEQGQMGTPSFRNLGKGFPIGIGLRPVGPAGWRTAGI